MTAASLYAVLSKALQYCIPSASEVQKLTAIANETKELVNSHTSPKILDVVVGGSFAKETWLKGDADIDIFLKIDSSVNNKDFEQIAIQTGWQSLKKYRPYLRYSEHPYVEAFVKGIRVNIVPCYDVQKGKWKSAADRSPFHTEYIKNELNNEKRNQVRLLKKFLKSIEIYGAEIAISGFSGYVTEVLILKYKTLELTLRALSNITKEKNVISINKPDEDIIKTFQSHLIIIDPIDPRRNLGAAISAESVGKFIMAARAFLEKPSIDFFVKSEQKKYKSESLRRNLYPQLLIIEFNYSERSPDVIWGQLKRSISAISKQLQLADFKVVRSRCVTDTKKFGAFIFLIESIILPSYTEKIGPEIFRINETRNFILKNKKDSLLMWINEEMRVTSIVQRRLVSAKVYLSYLLTTKIKNIGITKGLIEDIQDTVQIYTGDEQRKIKRLVRNAINELITTESIIFK
jgi:tRNA nucleotidyltransferase (CCA-adding enzyme)